MDLNPVLLLAVAAAVQLSFSSVDFFATTRDEGTTVRQFINSVLSGLILSVCLMVAAS